MNQLKLLYIFVKEYKKLLNQEYQFSDEYDICTEFDDEIVLSIHKKSVSKKNIFYGKNFNFTAITGSNGSGKTTVLKCLSGKNVKKIIIFLDVNTNELYCYSDFKYNSAINMIPLKKYEPFYYLSPLDIIQQNNNSNLCPGEIISQNFLKEVNRLISCGVTNFCFDEIDIFLHPEIQKYFVFGIYTFFKKVLSTENYKICCFNILLTTKSPMVLSDFDKNNIIFLKRNNCSPNTISNNVSRSNSKLTNSFAGNIYENFRYVFNIKRPYGYLGETVIKNLINFLYPNSQILTDSKKELLSKQKNKVPDYVITEKPEPNTFNLIENSEDARFFINIIGEKVFKNMLREEFDRIYTPCKK